MALEGSVLGRSLVDPPRAQEPFERTQERSTCRDVGRDARAATDAQLKAEILSYSRTQGVFAGINLSGGVLRDDKDDNEDLYGKGVSPHDVLKTNIPVPAEAKLVVDALKR